MWLRGVDDAPCSVCGRHVAGADCGRNVRATEHTAWCEMKGSKR